MKRIFIILAFFAVCLLLYLYTSNWTKEEKVFVFDYEQDLTKEQINKIDSLFKVHEKKTTNEIVLVTTYDYGKDTSMFLYAVNFGHEHGIGKKNKNNGVVIAFSNIKHKTIIATGLGTEKVLKDEIAKKIIDSLMLPGFSQGENFEGLWKGSKAIVEFLEKPGNKIN